MDVDTIAAVSTAPGLGGIAVVRISGPQAVRILRALTPGRIEPPGERRATLVELVDPGDGSSLDRAVATVFRAPASYTGEDVVELSCHGGWLVPQLVLAACEEAGARRAVAGEFTRRAYLHGKMDLVQAEATGDLIAARSRAGHQAALHQVERGLSRRLASLREGIVRLEALLAHHLDFPEEDDAPVPLERIVEESGALASALDRLLVTAPEGEMLRDGALTVLAGRPNTGKSSLYNALLGTERAIVTAEPGTTRDALEATVQLGGYPFRLVDTAGIRESTSAVERMGIEFARRYLERADVVLFCAPAAEGLTEGDRAFLDQLGDRPVVVLETKADQVDGAAGGVDGAAAEVDGAAGGVDGALDEIDGAADEVDKALDEIDEGTAPLSEHTDRRRTVPVVDGVRLERLRVSVVDGSGLDRLRELLPHVTYGSVISAGADAPIVTRQRHTRALRRARSELEAFRSGLAGGLPAEVAATHLRPAESALEELLGVISVDDVLDVVFREFCVGK